RRKRVTRVRDVVGAALLLALASPLLLLAALAIKLEDGGPVLYRQRRVGLRGAEFELLKLRTMVVGAESTGAGYSVNVGDPRITRVGRALRLLSLDELPQLWNVVRGEMSLVGPRPLVAEEDSKVEEWARGRLDLTPGITGLWQVLGRTSIPFAEMVGLDYL